MVWKPAQVTTGSNMKGHLRMAVREDGEKEVRGWRAWRPALHDEWNLDRRCAGELVELGSCWRFIATL
jgi:hypothetical protein